MLACIISGVTGAVLSVLFLCILSIKSDEDMRTAMEDKYKKKKF